VAVTSVINEKVFEIESFSIFCLEATVLGCSIHI